MVINFRAKIFEFTRSLFVNLIGTVFAPIVVWFVIGEFPGYWAIIGGSVIVVTLFIFNLFKLLKEKNSIKDY